MGILILQGRACLAARLSSHHGRGFFAQDFLWFVFYSREVKAPEQLTVANNHGKAETLQPICELKYCSYYLKLAAENSYGFSRHIALAAPAYLRTGADCKSLLAHWITPLLKPFEILHDWETRSFSFHHGNTPVVFFCWQWKAWK